MRDCLQELNAKSLAKLRQEEFDILNKIDAMSKETDTNTAKQIHEFILTSKEQITANEKGKVFKRKRFIVGLDKILKNNSDRDFAEKVHAQADKLPKSKTKTEAFVVKYSNGYSSDEITARLLKPSIASIEHITPASRDGGCNIANFMTVSKDWNASRGNRPLAQYIKRHPDIPENTKQYAQDIMAAIKDNRLTGCDLYPYVLKEKIFNESEGIIDIDISNYHIDRDSAFKNAPAEIKNIYKDLLTKNQKIAQKIN